MIEHQKDRGIGFQSISDGMIDTTSASEELVLNIFSALAQFERRLIQERTRAGLVAAKACGRKGGRPPMTVNGQVQWRFDSRWFCIVTLLFGTFTLAYTLWKQRKPPPVA